MLSGEADFVLAYHFRRTRLRICWLRRLVWGRLAEQELSPLLAAQAQLGKPLLIRWRAPSRPPSSGPTKLC